MTNKESVNVFFSQQFLAVVGVSRQKTKFGNLIYRELKNKGYKVFPVNPNTEAILGEHCYPNLASLPMKVGGVVIVVKPDQTEKVVKEASAAGIENIWLQQGSESRQAIQYCQENGLNVIHGECILMFIKNSFPHSTHRWIWKLIGKLPN